jgi:hypothetical protein
MLEARAASSRFVASTSATISRISGSRTTKRKPSARSDQYDVGSSALTCSTAATATGVLTNAQVMNAETAKVAALTNRVATGPTRATRSPAAEAPMSRAKRSMPSRRPTLRSMRTPARSVNAGSITRRAVCPGVSSSPAAKTSASRAQNGRPTVSAKTGMASTVMPLTRSATIAARRCPTRSTTTPPSGPPMTTGAVAKNAAMPTSSPDPPILST